MNINESTYTPVGSATTVAYTGTAGNTSDISTGTHVWVFATTAAYIAVGPGVTATTSNGTPVPANVPIVIPTGLTEGKTYRVSGIQVSTGGSIYVRPLIAHRIV